MSLTASDHCPSLDADVSSEGWSWPKAPSTPLAVSTTAGLCVIVPKGKTQGHQGLCTCPNRPKKGQASLL